MVLALAGTLAAGTAAPVQAASKSGWQKAYQSILSNWKRAEKYQDMSYLKYYFGKDYKFNQYFLYDLNGDSTPELFLYSTSMGMTLILSYNGKIRALGYDSFYGIHKKRHEIVVRGHWHGAGGSGTREWYVYNMRGTSKLALTYAIDKLGSQYSVYNARTGESTYSKDTYSKNAYSSVYNTHVKGTTKLSSFKKYKLSDKSAFNKYKKSSKKSKTPGKVSISSVKRAGSGKLKISWKKTSNTSGYQIYRSTRKSSGYKKIKTVSGKTTSYTNSRLKNGKKYYYKIRAYKKSGKKTTYGKFSSIKYQSPKKSTVSVTGTYKKETSDYGTTSIRVYKKNGRYYAKLWGRGGKMNTTVRLTKSGSKYTAYYDNQKKNGKFVEISSISKSRAKVRFALIPEFNGWYRR